MTGLTGLYQPVLDSHSALGTVVSSITESTAFHTSCKGPSTDVSSEVHGQDLSLSSTSFKLGLVSWHCEENAFGMKIWSLAMQQYISSFISLLFTLDDESGVVSY